jgi:protein-disulfide isomerase
MARISRKGMIAAATAVVVIVAAGAIAYYCLDGGEAAAQSTAKNYSVYKDDRTIGAPNAPAVLIEYAAPSCPHCAHFSQTVLPLLKRDYIDTGKVLYVLRVYPIMPVDGAVESVARCLPKEKYFPYIDFMFRNQPQWDPEYGVTNVQDALVQLSGQAGVSREVFKRCVTDTTALDRLNRVALDGQMRYDIHAVPMMVLNGKVVEGATEYPKLKAAIEAILAKK